MAQRIGGFAMMTDAPTSANRRELTVSLCDLVGSRALSIALDPRTCNSLSRPFSTTAVKRRGSELLSQISGLQF